MNSHPQLADAAIRPMIDYIFSLEKKDQRGAAPAVQSGQLKQEVSKPNPGHGAALEGVHPSFDLQDLHTTSFKPKVGGLAFMPDGKLLVTTWDAVGGVYILDNFQPDDQGDLQVKRIAAGLAEPLGLEVVDGEIYVLQKHELTHLIDLDGDEIIDYYR